jgi:thermitase
MSHTCPVTRRMLPSFFALVAVVGLVLAGTPAHASNDPEYKRQYGIKQVNAPSAWQKTRGAGVIIAVVDSGVDVDHPDLKPKLLKGYDFGDNDDNPDDDSQLEDSNGVKVQGHGTHVAGITAAATDNGIGVAGTAPDAKILPVKAFASNSGSLGFTAVPSAIRYAVQQGARVINLSLGTFDTGVSLIGLTQTPCSEALQSGALCVVASGNSGGDQPSGYPKDYPGLIVTANNDKGEHSSFGQKADTQWALSAPGVAVYSTYPVEKGGYATLQGTSMAAPHASGVAALAFAAMNPPKTAAGVRQVVERLLSTARPMGNTGTNGAGIIDAAAALGVPVVADEPSGGGGPPTTSPIPQTLNERQRQNQSSGGQKPSATVPVNTAPAGGAPSPAAPGDTTDPTAPKTKGIKLAGGPVAAPKKKDDGGSDSGKATLIVVAALALLGSAGWAGAVGAKSLSARRVKAF